MRWFADMYLFATIKQHTMTYPVAPFAGAWIETGDHGADQGPHGVAPFAGAWIETHFENHHRLHEECAEAGS